MDRQNWSNRQTWSRRIEFEIKAQLRKYLLGWENKEPYEHIGSTLEAMPMRARHNFQRERQANESKLVLYYRNRPFATVSKVDGTVSIKDIQADMPKTNYVKKILERVVYYDFCELRVTK